MKEEASDLENPISPIAAVMVIVLTFVAFLVISVASLILLSELPLGGQVTAVIGELTILLVPLAYMLYKKVSIKDFIRLGEFKPKILLLGVGMGLGTWLMGIFANLALTYVLGPSELVEEASEIIIGLAQESVAGLALMSLALFLAGVCEEFAFRGFLQNALGSKHSFPVALTGASLAFGLFHFDPQGTYTIIGFLYSLVWGYAYNRLKSFVAVASAHATNDLIGLTIVLLLIHMGMV